MAGRERRGGEGVSGRYVVHTEQQPPFTEYYVIYDTVTGRVETLSDGTPYMTDNREAAEHLAAQWNARGERP